MNLPRSVSGSGLPSPEGHSGASSSVLDQSASGPSRPAAGSMTLLRSGLRSEEPKQVSWLENILPRRGKTPPDREQATVGREKREPSGSSRTAKELSASFAGIGPEKPPRAEVDSTSDRNTSIAKIRFSSPRESSPSPPERTPGNRASLVGLEATLLFVGIGSFALLRGCTAWANFLFFATIFLLGISTLGMLQGQRDRKAFWQGFSLFGWGYMLLAFLPWFAQQTGLELPTSPIIANAHAKLTASVESPPNPAPAAEPATPAPAGEHQVSKAGFFAPGDLRQFEVVGHCWFALLAALLGAGISQRFFFRENLASD